MPASSPCEHEVYFGGSAATARFAMRLSKLSKSRSCAFSLVLNDSTTLRVSILVIQRAKMLMIRFSASVVRAVRIIETVQSSGFSFKRMPPKPSCDSQHAGPLRVNHVQCLVHSTNGSLELIMIQQSQQRLATALSKVLLSWMAVFKDRRPEILLREASSHRLSVRDLPKRTVT